MPMIMPIGNCRNLFVNKQVVNNINAPIIRELTSIGSISLIWLKKDMFNVLLVYIVLSVKQYIYQQHNDIHIPKTPNGIAPKRVSNPILLLYISSFNIISVRLTTLRMLKCIKLNGCHIRARRRICKYGIHSYHCSLSNILINGDETAESPIIIGNTMKAVDFIIRRYT